MKVYPDKPPLIVDTTLQEFPKRNPGGLYDEDLMCRQCERRFNDWDTYGAHSLIHRFAQDAVSVQYGSNGVRYRFPNWDESKLRLFALAVLWRAAATTNKYFAKISLGPHEDRLRGLIFNGDPGSPDDFSVAYGRWRSVDGNEDGTQVVLEGQLGRLESRNVAWLYFGRGWICIKCDKQPFGGAMAKQILRPGRTVEFVGQVFEGSPAFQSWVKAHGQVRNKRR